MRSVSLLGWLAACGFHPQSEALPVDAPPAATSCAGVTDAEVTLNVDGDPTKPWIAFCHAGFAYLPLANPNFGQYTAGGASQGTSVRTTYTRIKVDPVALTVDICDTTFATSSGSLMHGDSGMIVTTMPLGVAMSCASEFSSSGVANVDLTGTPFAIASAWAQGGNKSAGSTTPSARSVALTGGGYCGWNAPTGAPENPFNTFASSNLITVAYSP